MASVGWGRASAKLRQRGGATVPARQPEPAGRASRADCARTLELLLSWRGGEASRFGGGFWQVYFYTPRPARSRRIPSPALLLPNTARSAPDPPPRPSASCALALPLALPASVSRSALRNAYSMTEATKGVAPAAVARQCPNSARAAPRQYLSPGHNQGAAP